MSTILSRHSKLHCGVETQFFRRLKRRAENDFAHAGHWPDDGVDFIESLTINRQNVRGAYGVTKVDLRRLLAKHPPSTGHLLDIWLTEAARLQGKVRWIEKTPGHLLDVQTIRSIYPQAKIIRIMRDPRDCALSMSRMPWFHTHPLANLEMCAIWDWSANEFFQADPASRVVYYEELVSNPEESVSALCEFIDESYEQSMLESSPSKSTLIASGEWWKSNSLAEIDTTRTFQWKKTFRLDLLPAAELISHEVIVRHDYEQSNEPRQTFVCNEFDDPFASNSSRPLSTRPRNRFVFNRWNWQPYVNVPKRSSHHRYSTARFHVWGQIGSDACAKS